MCGNFGIFLAKRARCRIPWIFKRFFFLEFLLSDHLFKACYRHIHLATHLDKRDIALESERHRADGADIFGNIFADKTVTAGGTTNQHTVPIFQRHRKSINLWLNHIDRVRNNLPDAAVKVHDLLIRKDVLQRAHLNNMLYLLKAVGCSAANTVSRGIRS